MCIDTPVGRTGLLLAQQVTVNGNALNWLCNRSFNGRISPIEVPALVIGSGSSEGTVKLLVHNPLSSTSMPFPGLPEEEVPATSISQLPVSFRPGDAVYRARLDFQEEEAKVISVAGEYVTIQLVRQDGRPGITYASKAYRLRHVPGTAARAHALAPAPAPAAPTAAAAPPPRSTAAVLLRAVLQQPDLAHDPGVFAEVLRAVAASPATVREDAVKKLVSGLRPLGGLVAEGMMVNSSAFEQALLGPFLEELESAASDPNKVVDIVFHGTHALNVTSILRESLRRSPNRGDNWWFARHVVTTQNYGAVPVVFAVIHNKTSLGEGIITTQSRTHQLPLGHA